MTATKEQYASELFPDDPAAAAEFAKQFDLGDKIPIDDNVCQCETYEIGESRCMCGNVRISIEESRSGNEIYFNFAAC